MSRSQRHDRCPYDGKTRFRSWDKAEKVLRGMPVSDGRVYWCTIGGAYHITSTDKSDYDRKKGQYHDDGSDPGVTDPRHSAHPHR